MASRGILLRNYTPENIRAPTTRLHAAGGTIFGSYKHPIKSDSSISFLDVCTIHGYNVLPVLHTATQGTTGAHLLESSEHRNANVNVRQVRFHMVPYIQSAVGRGRQQARAWHMSFAANTKTHSSAGGKVPTLLHTAHPFKPHLLENLPLIPIVVVGRTAGGLLQALE